MDQSKMRFLIRLVPPASDREVYLRTIRSIAKSVGAEARNPKWTSYGALELDVFSQSREDFEVFMSATEPLATIEFSRDLNVAPRFQTREQLFREAIEYFNSERYWECHEVLESAWRVLAGEEKLYVQGIILVCAAFVHQQKAEEGVAFGVLNRASKQLDFGAETYHGIRVTALRDNVKKILATKRFFVFEI